jgi:hypothetical protein
VLFRSGVALVQQLGEAAASTARSDNRHLRRLLLHPETAHLSEAPQRRLHARASPGASPDEALRSAQALLLEQLQHYRRCEASST